MGIKMIAKFSWTSFRSRWVTSMTSWLVYDVINETIVFYNSSVKWLNYCLNAFVVDPTWTQTHLGPKRMTFDITSGPKVTSGLSKINETWTIWVSIDGKSYREYVFVCYKRLKWNHIGISKNLSMEKNLKQNFQKIFWVSHYVIMTSFIFHFDSLYRFLMSFPTDWHP